MEPQILNLQQIQTAQPRDKQQSVCQELQKIIPSRYVPARCNRTIKTEKSRFQNNQSYNLTLKSTLSSCIK